MAQKLGLDLADLEVESLLTDAAPTGPTLDRLDGGHAMTEVGASGPGCSCCCCCPICGI